jgi:hypothetical protein
MNRVLGHYGVTLPTTYLFDGESPASIARDLHPKVACLFPIEIGTVVEAVSVSVKAFGFPNRRTTSLFGTKFIHAQGPVDPIPVFLRS